MNIQNQESKEKLLEELDLLRQQVEELKENKVALTAQKKLIENLLTMVRCSFSKEPIPGDNWLKNWMAIAYSSEEDSLIKESLQQALDTSIHLTDAEKGSLFLLDSNGIVIESILTSDDLTQRQRSRVIGKVLEKGLAGWVAQQRQIGLITDTQTDERWLTLPHQTYTVGSALAVPILRGEELLAIITLQHSRPRHFSLETAELMEITINHIALVLEVAAREIERTAFEIQTKLLENLVEIARSPLGVEVLKSALQATLDIAAEQTGSERGSLFLLDSHGRVSDAILSRTEVTPEKRANLVGMVLDKGLAGWVIRHGKLGLILDTEEDERWLTLSDQPYPVRSALAVPIFRGGELLGIMTLLHSQPGHFSTAIARLMQATADQVALILENARLYTKLDEYSQALGDELKKGQQIQIDFLPYQLLQLPNWEIASCFYPAKQVAGDFYDVFPIGNEVGLVIADVCDKGVGAALFMALFRSLIRVFSAQTTLRGLASNILKEHEPDGEGWLNSSMATINLAHVNALNAVKLTNDYITQNHWQMGMFATLFFGVLNPETGIISYINGGHERLFLLGNSGVKATLNPTGPAVGMMPNAKFKIKQVQMQFGDALLGYTDGVTEAKNLDGQLFTDKRLVSLLERPITSAAGLLDVIKEHLFAYVDNAPQFDDITMLALHRTLSQ